MTALLEFNYSVQNETAQKATKHFVHNLENILEQYQKLWSDYLKLLKNYKESQTKLSNVELKLQEVTLNKNALLAKQVSIENDQKVNDNTLKDAISINEKQEISTEEESDTSVSHAYETTIPEIYTLDFDTDDLEQNYLRQCESPTYKSEQFSLVKSPVLSKRGIRNVKNNALPKSNNQKVNSKSYIKECAQTTDNAVLQVTQVNPERTPLKAVENNSLEASSLDKNQSSSVGGSKIYKKLGISTLYNVSTDISSNGIKKLKQSKLILQPIESKTDVSFCGNDDTENTYYCESEDKKKDNIYSKTGNSIPKSPPCFNRSKVVCREMSNDQEEESKILHDEDVITVSPVQMKFFSKIRNKLKCKRKESNSQSIENCTSKYNSSNSTSSDTDMGFNMQLCVPDAKALQFELPHSSQCPIEVKQEDKSNLMKTATAIHNDDMDTIIRSEKASPSESDNLLSKEQLLTVKEEQFTQPRIKSPGNNLSLKSLKKQQSQCNSLKAVKRKHSESSFSYRLCDDETFYAPGEVPAQRYFTDENDTESSDYETDITTNKSKHRSPPSKRNLVSSFDIVPVRKTSNPKHAYKSKPVRKRTERAKLAGWDCWECKKYYEGMGLNEEEIQMRKNQCSRHRAKCNERYNTPEGFWNPIFPDTLQSTCNNE